MFDFLRYRFYITLLFVKIASFLAKPVNFVLQKAELRPSSTFQVL